MIPLPAVAPRIISCDVFDTLLWRNAVCERSRVMLVERRAAEMLAAEHGTRIDPGLLWRARIDVQRHAYRALDMLDPSGEVRFDRMMAAMAASLGLGEGEADTLARAEIAVEITQLAANRPFLRWLARQDIRVIAISDTWHDAKTVSHLLDTVAPGHPVAKVYTSADMTATKRSGRIFAGIVAAEAQPAHAFLHIGDDPIADEAMPRAAGLCAHRLPRSATVLLRRRLNGLGARLRQGATRQ